uniref:Tripartite motif containing 35-30 n=1 Tax=Oryzias latipes TaxID=8090 RepID=A0A3P9LDB9_ORYLA
MCFKYLGKNKHEVHRKTNNSTLGSFGQHLKAMAKSEPWVGPWRPHKPRGPISAQFRSPGPKYELPSITGCVLQESTKRTAPAFTIGTRVKERPRSPGPELSFISTGKNTQGITFGKMLPPPKSFQVPGPGTYCPERSEHVTFPRVRDFSLAGRHPEKKKDVTPGPAAYNLFEKNPKAPSYTLKGRTKSGDLYGYPNQNPGPAAYKAVNSDTYLKKAPHYSFQGRNFMPLDKTNTPGPAQYHPKGESLTKRNAPCFTFGVHHSEYVLPVFRKTDEE